MRPRSRRSRGCPQIPSSSARAPCGSPRPGRRGRSTSGWALMRRRCCSWCMGCRRWRGEAAVAVVWRRRAREPPPPAACSRTAAARRAHVHMLCGATISRTLGAMCDLAVWRWRGGAARRALRQRTLQSDCSHRKTRPFGILESSCGRCGLVESPQPPERNTTHSPHSIPTPSSRLFDGVLVCGVHPPALSHAP
eukprot:COSAG06_NODE_9333_length_1927_cov_2.236324_1_plen_193_part_10